MSGMGMSPFHDPDVVHEPRPVEIAGVRMYLAIRTLSMFEDEPKLRAYGPFPSERAAQEWAQGMRGYWRFTELLDPLDMEGLY